MESGGTTWVTLVSIDIDTRKVSDSILSRREFPEVGENKRTPGNSGEV